MSDSVRPQRRQPTRLPCPWDSPGKNTGVGCHFLLQCMKVKSEREVAQSCPILSDPMECSLPGSSIHGIFRARVLEWGATAFSGIACYPVPKNSCCIWFVQFSSCLWWDNESGTSYSVEEVEISHSFGTSAICLFLRISVSCTISF